MNCNISHTHKQRHWAEHSSGHSLLWRLSLGHISARGGFGQNDWEKTSSSCSPGTSDFIIRISFCWGIMGYSQPNFFLRAAIPGKLFCSKPYDSFKLQFRKTPEPDILRELALKFGWVLVRIESPSYTCRIVGSSYRRIVGSSYRRIVELSDSRIVESSDRWIADGNISHSRIHWFWVCGWCDAEANPVNERNLILVHIVHHHMIHGWQAVWANNPLPHPHSPFLPLGYPLLIIVLLTGIVGGGAVSGYGTKLTCSSWSYISLYQLSSFCHLRLHIVSRADNSLLLSYATSVCDLV